MALTLWAAAAHAQSAPPAGTASPQAAVLRAYERGDYARVLDLCATYLAGTSEGTARAMVTYYLGAAHQRRAEFAQALAVWTQLPDEWPESPFAVKALLGVALVHAARGDWPACQAACERVLLQVSIGSEAMVAAYWRAEALAGQGAWPEAQAAYAAVLARPEDHALKLEARAGIIACLAQQDRPRAALSYAEQLATEAPAHPALAASWLRIAQAARNTRDAPLVTDAAARARTLDPRLTLPAVLVQAEVALQQGNGAAARDILLPLLAERGTSATQARLLADLAWASFLEGGYTRAVALYEQARDLHAGAVGPSESVRLGLSHFALRDYRAALDVLAPLQGEPALEARADSLNAVLAEASARARDDGAALGLLHTGLRTWPASPHRVWRRERIARLLVTRGAWTEAAQAYRAAAAAADETGVGPFAIHAAYADARAGRWSAVRTALRSALAEVPPGYDAWFYTLRGDAAAAGERWGAAGEAYLRAAARVEAPTLRTTMLLQAARAATLAEDRAMLERVVADATPADATAEIWGLLATVAEADGDGDAAREAWAVAAPFGGPAGARARLALAWDHLAAGRATEAVPFLAGGGEPRFAPWAQYGLAAVHLEQGAFRVAAAEFFNLADRYPGTPLGDDAAVRAADALLGAGAWREAENAYQTARQQVREPAARRAAVLGTAWTLATHGLEGPATTAFQSALAERADDADAVQALLWLGRTAFAWDRFAAAEEAFARALALPMDAADRALAEYWLARSLFEREQYVSAAATFAGCRRRPAAAAYEPHLAYWEMRCAAALGDDAAVLANAAALRGAFPETAAWFDVDMAVAEAHAHREAWADALEAYDRVVAEDTGRLGAQAMVAGAACLEAVGDVDGAIVRLFRVRPGDYPAGAVAEARVALGRTLRRVGRDPDARTVLQDVIRQYPGTPAADEAEAELAGLGAART